MLFNSLPFAAFFLIVFALYYLPPLRRCQMPMLLIASCIFYGWEMPKLLLLLFFSIFLNAVTSFQVAHGSSHHRVRWAVAGVVLNLAVLSVFKYGSLLTHLGASLMRAHVDPAFLLFHLPLPIGISFYTFEGISLLVDVLEGRAAVGERDPKGPRFGPHFARTALFIAFFPHLIAGPILKARNFYPQIGPKRWRDIDWNKAASCLIIGYFLKVVVADNLHDFTFWIASPFFEVESTLTLIVLLFGFSMQIFADFAGYSLIAIGLAALLGYALPDNFNFPYVSRSLAEFWRRWHISLSTWLRDYLYIPLGGNRKGQVRTYVNLMIVMLLGGLWHGAALSFMVWGGYHGVGLAVERWVADRRGLRNSTEPTQSSLAGDIVRALLVFCFVSLGWLLFKLQNFAQALDYLRSMQANVHLPPDPMKIVPVVLYSLPVVAYHLLHFPGLRERLGHALNRPVLRRVLAQTAYAAMLALICLNYGSTNAFIYFQF